MAICATNLRGPGWEVDGRLDGRHFADAVTQLENHVESRRSVFKALTHKDALSGV